MALYRLTLIYSTTSLAKIGSGVEAEIWAYDTARVGVRISLPSIGAFSANFFLPVGGGF